MLLMDNKILFKYAGMAGLLLLLQSCFVAKDYERPNLETIDETSFYRTEQQVQDSVSMADISWRELFTDPYLVSYIETGLQNNIDIRIALENIQIAEAYRRQSNTGYWPTLQGQAGVTHTEFFGDSPYAITQYDVQAQLSWEADIWGKIRSEIRSGEASYLKSVYAHQAVATELIAQIAITYYQLLALDEQLRIVNQTIENRTQSIETTVALKEAGQLTEVSVKQTEAQLKSVEALQLDLLQQIRLAENTLSLLLGENPREIERTSLTEQQIKAELSIGFPIQLLRNRPDVIAAEYDLIGAFENTNISRSMFYPSINLSVTGGLQSNDWAELLDVNSLFARLIGSIAQPIFNQRKIKTQYEVSLALQQQAALRFEYTLLQAVREVSDALYTLEISDQKAAIKREEYLAYAQALEYSEELINQGFGSFLEVLNARENTLNTQMNLISLQFEKLRNTVLLYRALGGGWK